MSETILTRRNQLFISQELTPLQNQVEGLVTRFVEEAADPKTLAALTAGGLAYRYGKIGVMSIGSGHVAAMPLRIISTGLGLGSEVTAFEFTNRTLQSIRATGQSPLQTPPNLWNWSGPGGWKQALINDTITFGLLKGAGHLSRESNLVFQHTFSSTAMVAGHQTSAQFGLIPKPEGSLAEQLLHAEVTNLQLGAGISLLHTLAPGVSSLERSLDLSLQSKNSPASLDQRGAFFGPAFAEGRLKKDFTLTGVGSPLRKNPFIFMSEGKKEEWSSGGVPFSVDLAIHDREDRIPSTLRLSPPVARYYEALPATAKKGVWILLHQIGLPHKYARDFLMHACLGGFHAESVQALEDVTLLHEYGVTGIETGFIPTSIDPKFLTVEKARLTSLLKEYEEAYWWASQTSEKVRLSPRLPIDWNQLSPEEAKYIEEEIIPSLEGEGLLSFSRQTQVEVDLGIYAGQNKTLKRIVEVKSTTRDIFDPGPLEEAKIFLQVFRHSLLVKQNRLEGLEYSIHAPAVSDRFLSRLEKILKITGVHYLVTVSSAGEKKILRSLSLHSIPTHGENEGKKTERLLATKNGHEPKKTPAPWTEAMKAFLAPTIEDFNVRHLDTAEEFITQSIKNLRFPGQTPLVRKMEDLIRKNNIPHASEVRKLFDDFKSSRTNTLSRSGILTLLKVVALLCGEPLEKISETPPSPSSDIDPAREALLRHQGYLEASLKTSLKRLKANLDSVETSLDEKKGPFTHEEILGLQDLLAEATREQPILGPRGEDWYLPKVLEIIENSPDLDWDRKIVKQLRENLQKYEGLLHRLENNERSDKSLSSSEVPEEAPENPDTSSAKTLPLPSSPYEKDYPELALVEEKILERQRQEMKDLGRNLSPFENRPLLQLLALLNQYGDRLEAAQQEIAENLRLEVLTASDSVTEEAVTERAYHDYQAHLRDSLLALTTLENVGLYPEIRGEGPALQGVKAGFAVQELLSHKALPPDLEKPWIEMNLEKRPDNDPEALEALLKRVAGFYRSNRDRILASPSRAIASEAGRGDLAEEFPELSLLPQSFQSKSSQDSFLKEPWITVFSLLEDLPEKSSLSSYRKKIGELAQQLEDLKRAGVGHDFRLAKKEKTLIDLYRTHRRPFFNLLAKNFGLENLISRFPEVAVQIPRDADEWVPLQEPPPFRLKGFDVLKQVGALWQKTYGTSLPNDLEKTLWIFEPPGESESHEGLETIARDQAHRLLQHYLNHREDVPVSPKLEEAPVTPPSELKKNWEFQWVAGFNEEERQHYLLETLSILRQDPLEVEISFQTNDGRTSRAIISASLYQSIIDKGESFPLSSGDRIKASQMTEERRLNRTFYNMREILLGLISPEIKKTLLLSDEAAVVGEEGPKKRLEKELHRTALLLVIGLSPRWVVPQLEKRMEELYQKDRNRILDRGNFTHDVALLPEVQNVSHRDWSKIWTAENLSQFLNYLPSLETYLRTCALIYRTEIPAALKEDFAHRMRKFKAAEKSSLRQKLQTLQRSSTATLSDAEPALEFQLDLISLEIRAASRFYLEHRDEILRALSPSP